MTDDYCGAVQTHPCFGEVLEIILRGEFLQHWDLCYSFAAFIHTVLSYFQTLRVSSVLGSLIFIMCLIVQTKLYYYPNMRNGTQSGCGIHSLSQSN